MENVYKALTLLVQGMSGIFTTIVVIMIIIWFIPKLSKRNEEE